jgi:lysophospholipase L1-like esterase
LFLLFFAALAAEALVVPAASRWAPWVKGEPVPLLGLVEETPQAEAPVAEAAIWEDTGEAARLPERPPAVPTLLELEGGELDGFYEALLEVESGAPGRIVRVLHWGDSTIAADGITGTVRARMQARFGDGGPGFLPVKVDPRWVVRPGIARWPKGDWEAWNITEGGAPFGRYGLAGTVSRVDGRARVTLGGLEVDGRRQKTRRFDVHFLKQPGGGTLSLTADKGRELLVSTNSRRAKDGYFSLEPDGGAAYLRLRTVTDGPVVVYGVTLETAGPGITWETLAVAGSSVGSMRRQRVLHLAEQVERRTPDLLIYQTGGNEMLFDSFLLGDGEAFLWEYLDVLERLRAGAPEASCLLIGPVDQATRVRGRVVSKPMMGRMVELQRRAAAQAGCGFWDAFHAMGGEGSYARWMAMEPPLTWSDLMHLSSEGRELVGDTLADALLDAYGQWKLAQSTLDSDVLAMP